MPSKTERYKFRIKNGYVEIRAVLVKGQRPRYFTGKTYEEAELKVDEAFRLANRDIITDRDDWGNRALGQWLDYWLKSVQRTKLQPTTYSQYETQLRLYVKPHPLALKKLQEIRYADIEPWRDWLESAPTLSTAARKSVRRVDYPGRLN